NVSSTFSRNQPGSRRIPSGAGVLLPVGAANPPSILLRASTRQLIQRDLQPHLLLHVQQRLGVAARIVDGMMGVASAAEMFEVLKGVLDQSLVERPEIGRAVTERIALEKMVEVPAHELEIEPVVV